MWRVGIGRVKVRTSIMSSISLNLVVFSIKVINKVCSYGCISLVIVLMTNFGEGYKMFLQVDRRFKKLSEGYCYRCVKDACLKSIAIAHILDG